jgi:hypothetical protein
MKRTVFTCLSVFACTAISATAMAQIGPVPTPRGFQCSYDLFTSRGGYKDLVRTFVNFGVTAQAACQDSRLECEYSIDPRDQNQWCEFAGVTGGGYPPPPPPSHGVQTVRCDSEYGRYNTCAVTSKWGEQYYYGRLVRQLSNTRCQEDVNYGFFLNTVWVDRGCRGVFEMYSY